VLQRVAVDAPPTQIGVNEKARHFGVDSSGPNSRLIFHLDFIDDSNHSSNVLAAIQTQLLLVERVYVAAQFHRTSTRRNSDAPQSRNTLSGKENSDSPFQIASHWLNRCVECHHYS
jgi:hypothetical protein